MTYRFLWLILLISSCAFGQQSFFVPHTTKATDGVGYEQRVRPDRAVISRVATPDKLAEALRGAPFAEAGGTAFLLDIPDPSGQAVTFRIVRYQIISDALQARYPQYVTAYGWDIAAPYRKVFLEWTELGFGASVTGGEEGRWYVAPQYWQRKDLYQSYYTHDYPRPEHMGHCGYQPDPELQKEINALGPPSKAVGDCELREYDLALACTGEYYQAAGGTEAAVVAELMTAINRVNQVFRADLAITLRIINLPVAGGGVELVFDNPNSDPYDNEDLSAMLGQNQTTLDQIIGSANYDIGHVFGTGSGGIASLNSPCTSFKAQGVSGLSNPTGDPFYIDFVAHEIGHQFGGRHSFNSTELNCDQRNASTAYEPGGGTTIQAYAGICGSAANIQFNSDPYYHAITIREIAAYMELGGGANCATPQSTSNVSPSVAAGPDFTIPANTPFVLTATGSDPDGDDLTWCWEQFDLGAPVVGVPTGNETDAPLFRSLPPVPSPQRFFPNLPDLVASGGATWEVLPRVARRMNFIVTLRDFGAAGYGCLVQDEMIVDVVASTGFAVTAPNGGETWQGGQPVTVTWAVAGTGAGSVVDAANVDLVLSTDGGVSFDQVLATVPNTGSATITAPATVGSNFRLMIRGNGNIFFDVGDGNFTISQEDYEYIAQDGPTTVCGGATSAAFTFTLQSREGYSGTITYGADNLPAGSSISFNPATTSLAAGGSEMVTATLTGIGGLASGAYTFQISADDGSGPRSEDFTLAIRPGLTAPTLGLPVDGGLTPAAAARFSWDPVAGATAYRWNLCQNANCSSVLLFNTTNTSITLNLTGNGISDGDGPLDWFVEAFDDNCTPIASEVSARSAVNFGTPPPSGTSLVADVDLISTCVGSTPAEGYAVTFFAGDLTGTVSFSLVSAPAGINAMFSPASLSANQQTIITLSGVENLASGSYTLTIRGDDGNNTEDLALQLDVLADEIPLLSPAPGQVFTIAADGDGVFSLDFDPVVGASEYLVVVSFPDGGTGTLSRATADAVNISVGPVANGDQFSVFVTADNGPSGCPVPFSFEDAALPVTWVSVTATSVGKVSQLEWSVIQDAAHAAFTVQRQQEGATAWENIGNIRRRGPDGPAEYSFTDRRLPGGGRYLYRIQQEDFDGRTDFSEIVSVRFGDSPEVVAFPNPVSDLLFLRVGDALPANLRYQLFSALGQPVAAGALSAGGSTLHLTDFPAGVYQLLITDPLAYRQVIRVVRQ